MALVAGLVTFLVAPRHQSSPRGMAAKAAEDLRAWHGVTYTGTTVDGDGVVTRMRMTVTRDGTAYGTLSRDFGALAEIAVSPDRTLLRGNRQWWLGDEPSSADSLADTWILNPPRSVTGLVPGGKLTPAALADAVLGPDGARWRQAGTTTVGGHPARVLTNGTQRILVASSFPHRLLSVGLPVPGSSGHRATPSSGTAGVHSVVAHGPPRGVVRPLVYRGSGDAVPPAGLSSAVSEADDSEVERTAAAVRRLGEEEAKPAKLGERITVQPDVTVQLLTPDCGTPTCSTMVTVDNGGPGTVNGRLMVSEEGQSLLDTHISVPAGASQSYQAASSPNRAPPGGEIYTTIRATLYNPAVMGDDPALVRRLADRGLNLNKSAVAGQPNGKAILQTLDAMTSDIHPDTDQWLRYERVREVTGMVSNLIRQRALQPFHDLVVKTDNLSVTVPDGFREMRENTAQLSLGDIRVLRHAADLGLAGHKVHWGTTYYPDGSDKGYKADLLDLTTRQAFHERTVTGGTGEVGDAFKEVVKEFRGETGGGAPPGFDKVARINIEPNATTSLVGMSRADLLKELRKLDLERSCAPAGEPVVDRVVITNHLPGPDDAPAPATHVFHCADLRPQPPVAEEQSQPTAEERKQLLAEQIWKANNDPAWFKRYYRRNDAHRHDAEAMENGVLLPVLAKDGNGNWISRDSLPAGPSAIRFNLTYLDHNSAPRKNITPLNTSAMNRRVSVDLGSTERAHEKNLTTKTRRALEAAQKAYHKQLGDRPNNSSIPEQFGEDAARYHVIPAKFPDAKPIKLPKTPNGANMFDQLYKLDDGSYLIVEAKAPKSDLLWRRGAGQQYEKMLVQQGTVEYLHTIIAAMAGRGRPPKDHQLARELGQALEDEKLQYVLVKAKENSGSYAGATLEHFKIY
ncbi:hypothetical protein [Streptomyces atratus]|uniref:hypothetical protein n=1 Tax=Streptomyces atratus TaxID=1893 RepID=UPI0036471DDB